MKAGAKIDWHHPEWEPWMKQTGGWWGFGLAGVGGGVDFA